MVAGASCVRMYFPLSFHLFLFFSESRQKLHVKFAQVRDISKEEVQQVFLLIRK